MPDNGDLNESRRRQSNFGMAVLLDGTAIVTPNSDTRYSMILMDLPAEPIVLCVAEVEKGRYYSVQLVDMYTWRKEWKKVWEQVRFCSEA